MDLLPYMTSEIKDLSSISVTIQAIIILDKSKLHGVNISPLKLL